MAIELPKEVRREAVASIERYFRENMEERIGNLAAGALLSYFLEEIGPAIYNRTRLKRRRSQCRSDPAPDDVEERPANRPIPRVRSWRSRPTTP